jgi:putative membrane protein
VTRWRKSLSWLAVAALAAGASLSPALDRLADASFAWHMAQHVILFYLVALALLLARPFELYARVAGKRATAALVRASRPLHALASPAVALPVFIAVLWATHFSPLYELALERQWVHAGEHLLYVAAGTVFWLPVLSPPPLLPVPYPARLLYLALALPQGALLGMVIGGARSPLYPHYVAAAGSAASALADQRDAAAVMWISGGLIAFIAFLFVLGAWARRECDDASAVPASVRSH